MNTTPKNATIGLDRDETKDLNGRTLYRVVALADIPALGVAKNDRGGWCSEESQIPTDRVQWIATSCTFRGGTFWGGTFEGGTFRGGTFEGGTFWGGTSVEKQPLFLAGLRWEITFTDNHMSIGCQHHTLAEWWNFSDGTIDTMDLAALEFWHAHKTTLQALCAATGRLAC